MKEVWTRLDEICDINMGQSPDSNSYNQEEDGFPFFQGNADFGELYPITRMWCNKPTKIVNKNALLISVRAPIGALNFSNEKCCIGRGLAGLTGKGETNLKYVYYCLKYKNVELNNKGTGSTFKAINKSALSEIQIKVLSAKEQEECVTVLDKINSIINSRKQQLKQFDNLIKSRFVEMFGTIDDTIFSVETLNELCEFIKDGTHQTPTYTDDKENGYKFLSSKDVKTGKIDWTNIKYIPKELHDELYKRISPQRGDILLAKNGTTGVAALVDNDEVFDIYVSLALLRFKGQNNSQYLLSAINSVDTKRQFDCSLKGVGVPNLHLGEIKKIKIIIPPLDTQAQFANFVKQVEKLKFDVKKSLDETQLLFDSLMQKYFG